jgi:transposase
MEAEKRRYVGIDLGKREYTLAIIGKNGKMSIHQGKTSVQGRAALYRLLEKGDKVALEAVKILSGQEKEEAEWLLKHLDLYEQRIKELKGRMSLEAKTDENMKNLQSIAGVGTVVAYAFVAHVGDGSRFRTGAQVSNYLGFVPRLDYSGTIQRQGHITKRGNGYLRGLLVQAAWSTVRSKSGGALKERYRYKTEVKGLSKKKTIVSIGRRLAELMYSILKNKTSYEVRPWVGVRDAAASLAKQALSA